MYSVSIGAPKDNQATCNRVMLETDTPRGGRSWKTRSCSAAAATFLIAFGAGMIATNSASHAAASHEVAGTQSFSFGTISSQPYEHAMDMDTGPAPIVVAQASGGGAGGDAMDHPEMVDGDGSGWFVEGGLSYGTFSFFGFNVGAGRVFESGAYARARFARGSGTETINGVDIDFDGTFVILSSGYEIGHGHFLGGGLGLGSVEASSGSASLSLPGLNYGVEYIYVLGNGLVVSGGLDSVFGLMAGVGYKF